MVLTLLEVFMLGHCDPPSTGRMQVMQQVSVHNSLPQNCWNYLKSTYLWWLLTMARTIQF